MIHTYVLGVHSGHNATAALLKDGAIIAAVSEERFNRKKNYLGFPKQSIAFVLKQAGITMKDVQKIVISGADPRGHKLNLNSSENFMSLNTKHRPQTLKEKTIHRLQQFMYTHRSFALVKYRFADWRYKIFSWNKEESVFCSRYAKLLRCPEKKISFISHHEAHALSPCFNLPKDKKTLILTNDGEGDDACATVNVFDGRKLKVISRTPKHFSLGWLYMQVTVFLGMKGNQHEFKVMGLAPYAKEEYTKKVYDKLRQHFYFSKKDPLAFESSFISAYSNRYLDEEMYAERFDNLAGGAQLLVEELLIEWTRRAVKKTGIKDLAVSGGVFMNVKAAMRIAEMPEVRSLFVMPSAGDESLAFGACYKGYEELCTEQNKTFSPLPVKDLYLGPKYDEKYVKNMIRREKLETRYKIDKLKNVPQTVAKLLATGNVVAHHNGRSEWGARALGNRSILADPQNEETVMIINEMIKDRDFWMPFTPSVLPVGEEKYIINPKSIFPPYMCITFRSTKLGQKHLKAAKHPYDHTIRPQVVLPEWNPRYHAIITEFEKLTGVSGVLNTSFNLHGEPNVETPEDAIRTVDNSGLKYLVVGEYLFEKKW